MPGIFIFFLFNNNKVNNILYFYHFAILFVVFAVFSLFTFILYQKITKSEQGALVLITFTWIFFWLFDTISGFISKNFVSFSGIKRIVLILMVAFIIVLVLLLRKYKEKIAKTYEVFNTITVLIVLLFIYNFGQAFYSDVLILMFNPKAAEKPYLIRTEFVVDESLPTPDIYWLHMDGMVSFATTEKYFNDPQYELKYELNKRGFIINEDAGFHAGRTYVAVPALTCPDFYDSYLEALLTQDQHLERLYRGRSQEAQFKRDRLELDADIAPLNELFNAFITRDYRHIIISTEVGYGLVPFDIFYQTCGGDDEVFIQHQADNQEDKRVVEFARLLGFTELIVPPTPMAFFSLRITEFIRRQMVYDWLPIPAYDDIIDEFLTNDYQINEEKMLYRTLADSFQFPSPKFVYVVNSILHEPYSKIYESGARINPSPDNVYNIDLLYMPLHHFTADTMLNTIDMILAQNPNAIIVIQADHGIHHMGHHDHYMKKAGYTIEQIIEINFSTISAVRIPERYGGLDEPVDPLNIARLLVNRYVGQNYIMLSFD